MFSFGQTFSSNEFFPKSKVYKDFFNPLSHHSRNYLSYSRTEATLSKSYKKGTKAVKHKKLDMIHFQKKKLFFLSPQTYFFCKPTISMPSLSKTMISKKKKNRKKRLYCIFYNDLEK